jgi:hypothetical protein
MTKVAKNVLTRGLSGKLGNLLVFRNNGQKTIMAAAPGRRTHALSQAQKLHQQHFKQAVLYAKAVMADPQKKAEYMAAAKEDISAYNVAVADFMIPPVVQEIDTTHYTGQVGEKIRIRAMDNFKIANVSVGIFKSDETEVESGSAIAEGNGLDWIFTTSRSNKSPSGGKVVATVTDTPGHAVLMTQVI